MTKCCIILYHPLKSTLVTFDCVIFELISSLRGGKDIVLLSLYLYSFQMAKKRGFYLIEEMSTTILGAKLPSKEQVLSVFLHHHMTLNKGVSESASIVTSEVEAYWKKARLPVQRNDKIQEKVKKLFNQWKLLKKNKGRRGKQEANEKEFQVAMKNLFDVAHANAMSLIHIQEDKEFLIVQREPGRRGSMGAMEKNLELENRDSLF